MKITVNGEEQECKEGAMLAQWVQDMGYDPKKIAVEVNREIVPKAEYGNYELHPADKLEVVTFVGGG